MSKQYRYDIPVEVTGTITVSVEAPDWETAKKLAEDEIGDYDFCQFDSLMFDIFSDEKECLIEEVNSDSEPESSVWCMAKIQRFGNEIYDDVTKFRFASDAQKAFDEYVSLINAVFKEKGIAYSATYSKDPYSGFVISNINNDYVRVYITRKAIENENHS